MCFNGLSECCNVDRSELEVSIKFDTCSVHSQIPEQGILVQRLRPSARGYYHPPDAVNQIATCEGMRRRKPMLGDSRREWRPLCASDLTVCLQSGVIELLRAEEVNQMSPDPGPWSIPSDPRLK